MAATDNIRRQIEVVEAAIKAKKSGMPDELVVLTYDSTQVDAAKQEVLAQYETTEEAVEAAGSDFVVGAFDWCNGRGVGLTDSRDERIPEAIRESVETFHKGRHVVGVRGATIPGNQGDEE